MRKSTWFVLPATIFFIVISFFLITEAHAQPLKFSSTTQFLWGDDLLGESQSIVAQYLRFSYSPEGLPLSLTGYGRLWYDFGSVDTYYDKEDFEGRLYYLYLDIIPFENSLLRLGRQYVNFSAGSSLMDGVSFSAGNIGYLGVTAAFGRDIQLSLDSEYSQSGNYFMGIDLHLEKVRSLQLGASFVLRSDDGDRAREEVGMNFRYIHRYASPYAEVRYDIISETIDEATVGIDLFPLSNLMIKGEFYHSYPTFDATSIYSVFAVDKYQEYLVRAEYSFDAPVTIFASYAHQTYEDSDDADIYTLGARLYPLKNLTLSASVDYRNGYGGNLWGFEVLGDYRIDSRFLISAGAQYNSYRRPDFTDENYDSAQRYWIGAQYAVSKTVSFSARIEDNINENFDHRPLGRIALNWTL